MKELRHLFANNRAWADKIRAEDPDFFAKLSRQQAANELETIVQSAGKSGPFRSFLKVLGAQ